MPNAISNCGMVAGLCGRELLSPKGKANPSTNRATLRCLYALDKSYFSIHTPVSPFSFTNNSISVSTVGYSNSSIMYDDHRHH